MKLQKVYLSTKVEDELPEIGSCYFMFNDENNFVAFLSEQGHFKEWVSLKECNPTHWLKEQEVYTATHEQLEAYTKKVIKQAFESDLKDYVLVQWPESQEYMEEEWFDKEAILADESVGSAAYFIHKDRLFAK